MRVKDLVGLLVETGKRQAALWAAVTHMDIQRCEAVATRRARIVVSQVAQRAFARKSINAVARVRRCAGAPPPRCGRVFGASCEDQARQRSQAKWR